MDVYACFELNTVDAPILLGIKTYAAAMEWCAENWSDRFMVCFKLDLEEVIKQLKAQTYGHIKTSHG